MIFTMSQVSVISDLLNKQFLILNLNAKHFQGGGVCLQSGKFHFLKNNWFKYELDFQHQHGKYDALNS